MNAELPSKMNFIWRNWNQAKSFDCLICLSFQMKKRQNLKALIWLYTCFLLLANTHIQSHNKLQFRRNRLDSTV